jgi:cytochrome c-type biogenesis protein CcmH
VPVRVRPRAPYSVVMLLIQRLFLSLLLLVAFPIAKATTENTSPSTLNTTQLKQYRELISELRCVVCQNQDLADSNAPLAIELRQEIAIQIMHQASNTMIKAYLSKRYGEFVLFKPSFTPKNYLLWLAPFGLCLLCLGLLAYYIKQSQRRKASAALSTEEQEQLTKILKS